MRQRLIDWVRGPFGGAWFVVGAVTVVALAGYVFPDLFPDADSDRTDRLIIWLEIILFGGSAALMLVQTRWWTWLNRAIVWVFLGVVLLYLLLVSRHEGWTFTRSENWLWMTRFVLIFGAIIYLVSLIVEKIKAVRGKTEASNGD